MYIYICMQNHNDDTTIKTSDTVLRKIYLSLYLKVLCVRRSWRLNRTATYWPPTLMAISVSFLFSWAAQPGAWRPSLSECWFSLPHLISNLSDPQLIDQGPEGSLCWVLAFSTASCLQLVWSPNWLNFLCTALYNSSTPTFFLWMLQSRSFNPSTVKVIFWYSCYLNGCTSHFDSPARS